MPIMWDTTVGMAGDVSITISRDGGRTYEIIVEATANDGRFDWVITGPGSVNCMMKITPLAGAIKKTVQGLFSIVKAGSGDIDNNGMVDLADSILAARLAAGMTTDLTIYTSADVNGDGRIGCAEAVFALKKAAGLEGRGTKP